ncbi:MAG TPA: thioredoxin domain-containing protein [Gemmatimonadales bacterium]|nr:thioredoxin domain-containing protein [Gemmatimonadales bacterium]
MPNHLAAESSPYLKSAAHQPVHWYPWGDAAFARARELDRPILLDIGAVWCHWCHVMDGESYEQPDVAEILNEGFVAIKVDRDERPDVDQRYQRAVQALSGQGGWPLTAFLTPDGDVFFGGTYFPPEKNPYGQPGFGSVLRQVDRAYRTERARVARSAAALRRHVAGSLDEAERGEPNAALLAQATDAMGRPFDVRYGGFGTAPKFPAGAAVEFLLARWFDERTDWMREVVEKTLTAMARGGIRDHLGGGFHRYSVDERWIVPHFEKLIYDNAQLLSAYCSAYAAFGTPLFAEVAEGIVTWVLEVLSDRSQPAFFSSQDADVTFGDDGDYWTWTQDEARRALSDEEFHVVERVFDIGPEGEMHHNAAKNVLWRRADPAPGEEAAFRGAVAKLNEARDRRPRPQVDTTAYVGWNGMMAGAFLRAGAILDRPECTTLALGVLERLWDEAWNETEGMAHVLGRPEPRGFLDDNVHAAAAFLDAYEATGAASWLARARGAMSYVARAHSGDGGFFDVATGRRGAAYLATPATTVQDAPTPSGNGVAALVLARLWALTGEPDWRERLERQLGAVVGALPRLGIHGATLAQALDWVLHPVTRIEVGGPTGPGPACAMHLLALQAYRPRKVVLREAAVAARAVVCVGTTCSLPVDSPPALAAMLHVARPQPTP